jgi:SAM-dependent methyltransferase
MSRVFDEDYAYFYEHRMTGGRTEREVDLIWRLLGLRGGEAVLDVPCGGGRVANRLAQRGCRVVGVDAAAAFIERARADAAAWGLHVEYLVGDMRELAFEERFDCAVNWFTSFGYFDHDGDMRQLRGLHRSLRPGGLLLLDMMSRDALSRAMPPGAEEVVDVLEVGDDLMVDRWRLDVVEGRCVTHRVMVRDGRVRRSRLSFRLPTYPELRHWLMEAGFTPVDVYDEDGAPYSARSGRMIVVARR